MATTPSLATKDNQTMLDNGINAKNTQVKIICLGDSAVGKSKLVERFLLDNYKAQPNSTYALQLYKHTAQVNGEEVDVDIWDTAGQELFNLIHPSYYHAAHACILVFDATRKVTYRNLQTWYEELRAHRPSIPVLVAANKIDAKNQLPLYYVSASDGTNVVKLFKDALKAAMDYKGNNATFEDQILENLSLL